MGYGVKILHLASGTARGAVEQQLERLVGALRQAEVDQYVLLGPSGIRGERLAALGVEARELDFPGRFRFLDRRTINGEIRRFGPDIVISWATAMAPLVDDEGPLHVGYIGRDFDMNLVTTCRHLLASSKVRGDKAIAAGWSTERLHILPLLVGPDAVAAGGHTASRKVDRKNFYTPSTTKLVVTAAEFNEGNGIDTLIKAIARLSGFYLWIAGDGPQRAALEEYAHELGVKPRVRFLGWQDDLQPFLSVADMFVSPGAQDDTGEYVVAAWAAGLPVIAADSLGPGLLISQRENGVLVPVSDAINLAEAIKWLSRDAALSERLAAAGTAAFAANWPLAKVMPQYTALFEQLAKRPVMTLEPAST
jgi:glycosyltransferase involved in cell wall biosynthesis